MSQGIESLQATLGTGYNVMGELARGGMATLYRARDLRHNREVAVKVFDSALASVVGLKRFQNEIAIAGALHHPSIVPLYDSGGSGDCIYYTMPLIHGDSLRARLEREKQLTLDDALRIGCEIADALAFAHAHGVVHRDIKPENILLAADHAMVTDFGIARALYSAAGDRLTSSAIAIGTPIYMAPEQADPAADVDGRADIYALGCVLFEMLAGDPPFSGRTAQAIIARHQAERPPSLQVVRSTVPAELQSAVERALAKAPADRFATAAEFGAALTSIRVGVSSGTLLARPITSARVRKIRLTVAAVAGLAAVSVGGWWLTHRAGPVSDNRVVVFPFEAPGTAADAGTGEQVALMIGSALEHTEPLRWLDGQELLGGRRGDVAIRRGDLAREARTAGARYYVDGAVVASRDSLTVIVKLFDVARDSLLRQESSAGAVASATAPQLALRAMGLILPRLLPPNSKIDLSYLADRNAAAIADWLQGEREYSRSQYSASMDHMNRALEKDSAMGVAALKGAQAAAALEDFPAALRLIDVAIQLDHQLPRHDLALARGLRFYLVGSADSAIAEFQVAHRADTTWSEPWKWLGETYYHLFPSTIALDSLADASFAAAIRLNPTYAPALFHLAESAARRGDRARARELFTAFRAVSPDSDWTRQLDLTVRCAADGPQSIDWAAAVRSTSDRVVNVARVLGAGGRYPACAKRALEAVLAFDTDTSPNHRIYRWSALKGLDYQVMAEGREDRMVSLLDSALKSGVVAAPSLYILDASAGSRLAEARADTAMIVFGKKPINQVGSGYLRYLSLWAWHRGDVARLDSVAVRSLAVADSTHRGTDRLVAGGAAARLALLKADTTTAIRILGGLQPANGVGPVTWDFWEGAAAERLLLAQLLVAAGDARRGMQLAELFDSPRSQINLLYLPASLRVRVAAASRLGLASDRDRATERLRDLAK